MQSFHIEFGLANGVSKSTGLTGSDQRGIACQRKMVSGDIGRRYWDADRRRFVAHHLSLRISSTSDSTCRASVFHSSNSDLRKSVLH